MESVLINKRYVIEHQIGQGAMGSVYRAQDQLLDRAVAIKVFTGRSLGTIGRARFLAEAKNTAKLSHPNIVTVHDAGEHEGIPFIVMELVDGMPLSRTRIEGFDRMCQLFVQICRALEHAHQAGIIHRDIKPENVMICSDGTTRLVDFGIARSTTSRFTEDGAFLGTLYYMSPEQAMGTAIDQRSDLYSLGVMMYELFTGQLPFESEDTLAVITQHLHAPVVPPRAQNPDIPAALDDLILHLMKKSPDDRPKNAEKVREKLEACLAHELSAEAPARVYGGLDRIVRGRMVGRDAEVSRVRMLWKKAAAGEGQLLLISGEPGIGKSRFIQEICTQAGVSGGKFLIGESYAESSAPYSSIAQIVRQILNQRNGEIRLPDFVLSDLTTLTPDLLPYFPDLPPNPPLDPESAQQRLFENILRMLMAVRESAPLLLVIEDVHWADGGTLSVLQYLARRTKRQPVMLVATYREVELDSTRPLKRILEAFSQEHMGERIKLNRLDETCTAAMLRELFDEEITSEFLASIYRETEGNPFFVEELVKALVDSGVLYFKDGAWHRPEIEALNIPQGIRVAIQSRLNKLAPHVQNVLRLAAIIGRKFKYELLLAAHRAENKEGNGADENVLIEALETAENAQIIQEIRGADDITFQFTHALITNTLVESVRTLRRRRLHRRAALAFEDCRPEDHDALAYHWQEAGEEERSLRYMVKAARQARRTYANEDAIRIYSEVLEEWPTDDPEKFDLLAGRQEVFNLLSRREEQFEDIQHMLAWADEHNDTVRKVDGLLALAEYFRHTTIDRAEEPAQQALKISEELDDNLRKGRALFLMGALSQIKGSEIRAREYFSGAVEAYRDAGQQIEMARSLSMLSLVLEDKDERIRVAQEALEQSKKSGDKLQIAICMRRLGIAYSAQFQLSMALPLVEESLRKFREIGHIYHELNSLNVLGLLKSSLGKIDEAEETFLFALDLAIAHAADVTTVWLINNLGELRNFQKAEYERQLKLIETHLEHAQNEQNMFMVIRLTGQRAFQYYLLGDYEAALAICERDFDTLVNVLDPEDLAEILALMGLYAAEAGDQEKARRCREESRERLRNVDESSNTIFSLLVNTFNACISDPSDNKEVLQTAIKEVNTYQEYFRGKESKWGLGLASCVHAHICLTLFELGEDMAKESLDSIREAEEIHALDPAVYQPEKLFLLLSRAYRANNLEEEADLYLEKAHAWMMMAADKITDLNLRDCYLNNVRENRAIQSIINERSDRENSGISNIN